MTASRRAALFLAPLLCSLVFTPLLAHAWTVGSGRAASETRPVAEFQAIALQGDLDLVVRQGKPQSVQVQADDNLLPMLESVVETTSSGSTLQLRWAKGQSLHTRSKARITVVVPALSAVVAAGSGDVLVESFNTPALKLSLSGSGDARLPGLATDDLGIRVAGSSNVSGSGKAARLSISIAGSGDVKLSDLRADDVAITIAGSGDAAVDAQKTLEVRIAGSGEVSYSGNPTVKSKIAGSGGLTHR